MKQGGIGDQPALVKFADQILTRDADILEKDLIKAGVTRHLDQGTNRDPRRLHIDQNIGDTAMLGRIRVGPHQTEHPV